MKKESTKRRGDSTKNGDVARGSNKTIVQEIKLQRFFDGDFDGDVDLWKCSKSRSRMSSSSEASSCDDSDSSSV